jgi:hypothetical protein
VVQEVGFPSVVVGSSGMVDLAVVGSVVVVVAVVVVEGESRVV